MRLKLSVRICNTCLHLDRDHIGNRGRCQHDPRCPADCQKFVKGARTAKYGNVRIGGADSKLEANRFADLAAMLKGGAIRELRIHPRLEVQPEGCETIFYKPDAVYEERTKRGTWVQVCEDCKASGVTDGGRFALIWKLLRARHPDWLLRISEKQRGRWVFHDDLPREQAA